MAVRATDSDIQLFGSADYTSTGSPASNFPSWYFDGEHITELQDRIALMDAQLKGGLIPESEVQITKQRLSQYRTRMAEIQDGRPKLTPQQKDKMAKAYNDFGKMIGDAMFTRDEMFKGLANPQKEAERMSEAVCEISPDHIDVMKACGISVDGRRKVSRTQLERAWKITGKYLGENSNSEYLRRQGGTTANY
jgi:hypothetical protein